MTNIAFIYRKGNEYKLVQYSEVATTECKQLEKDGFKHLHTVNTAIIIQNLLLLKHLSVELIVIEF